MPNPPDGSLPQTPWSQRILRNQIDEAVRAAASKRLRDRRKARRNVVQFEELPDPKGKLVPVVAGQLLLRSADLTPATTATLTRHGLTAVPVPELDGRVRRIAVPPGRTDGLAATHDALRRDGVAVSPDAVTPMGALPTPNVVWKSVNTPEPVATPLVKRPEATGLPAIRVAVLDTGITPEQRADGWLLGLAHANGDNVDPLDVFPTRNGFLDLGAGHGTFVSGIIQRLAPAARLEVWRALDSDGLTDEVTVAAMMVAAARGGADILNLSLGTETFDDREPVALAAALELIREIEERDNRQIVVVAAAGNSGTKTRTFPAAFAGVTAVAALTPTRQPAPWSSRGTWVDCSAIGENVVSTYVQGREDQFVRPGETGPAGPPDEYGPSSWALWSGTSFAAPQVSARIARLAQEKDIGVRAAADELVSGPRTDPDYGVFLS